MCIRDRFKGDVGIELFLRKGLQEPAVLVGHTTCLRGIANTLAEQRRRDREPPPVRLARNRQEIRDALARDETPRAEAHAVASHAAAHDRIVGGRQDCRSQGPIQEFAHLGTLRLRSG